ncbi:MAG TPA: SLATT domain-containing protein [Vicinamibacterales bacterium]|nr:SLATT domain-containing protein [Vicinamibacterales bacterium]
MFSLTLLDHLRLTFNQVIHSHHAHTRAAQLHARRNRRLRGAEAILMGGVTITAAGAAFGHGQILAIVAAVLAGAALIVLLVHLTFDFETSAQAHAACSTHLRHIRERYRALLSDLHDGVLNVTDARLRRDALMEELAAIYERTPAMQLEDYRASRRHPAAGKSEVTDEEVDLFLPKPLQVSPQPPAS